MVMCAAVTVMALYRLLESKGNGNCSVVMCAAVTVMVWYSLGETKGNGKCSVVMCATVTVMVWYRLGRRMEMERFQKFFMFYLKIA